MRLIISTVMAVTTLAAMTVSVAERPEDVPAAALSVGPRVDLDREEVVDRERVSRSVERPPLTGPGPAVSSPSLVRAVTGAAQPPRKRVTRHVTRTPQGSARPTVARSAKRSASSRASRSQPGAAVGCGARWRRSLSGSEAWIIEHESHFDVHARNPSSSAFGLGQLTIGNRRSYARRLGTSPGTTNPCKQLAMFRMYVRERYGSAGAAVGHWRAHGWY